MPGRAASRCQLRLDLRSPRWAIARSWCQRNYIARVGRFTTFREALMADVTILVRKDGPLWVIGDFNLVDAEGNSIPIPEAKRKVTPEGLSRVSLCRCGGSVIKPFCDGTHS